MPMRRRARHFSQAPSEALASRTRVPYYIPRFTNSHRNRDHEYCAQRGTARVAGAGEWVGHGTGRLPVLASALTGRLYDVVGPSQVSKFVCEARTALTLVRSSRNLLVPISCRAQSMPYICPYFQLTHVRYQYHYLAWASASPISNLQVLGPAQNDEYGVFSSVLGNRSRRSDIDH